MLPGRGRARAVHFGAKFCEHDKRKDRGADKRTTKMRRRTLRKGLPGRKVKIARHLVHLDIAVCVAALAAVNDGLLVDALVHALLD